MEKNDDDDDDDDGGELRSIAAGYTEVQSTVYYTVRSTSVHTVQHRAVYGSSQAKEMKLLGVRRSRDAYCTVGPGISRLPLFPSPLSFLLPSSFLKVTPLDPKRLGRREDKKHKRSRNRDHDAASRRRTRLLSSVACSSCASRYATVSTVSTE